MSPYLPIPAQEIADVAVEAAEAGAAIVRLHVREPGAMDFCQWGEIRAPVSAARQLTFASTSRRARFPPSFEVWIDQRDLSARHFDRLVVDAHFT